MREPREGYEWKETSSGGYWSKLRGSRHDHSHPIFCPNEKCKKISGTVDNKYFEEYGVCYECYIMNIENRKTPLIDVEFYQKRLKERGY